MSWPWFNRLFPVQHHLKVRKEKMVREEIGWTDRNKTDREPERERDMHREGKS